MAALAEIGCDTCILHCTCGDQAPQVDRCSLKDCRSADDDELDHCEECGQRFCKEHLRQSSDGVFSICTTCSERLRPVIEWDADRLMQIAAMAKAGKFVTVDEFRECVRGWFEA